MSNIQQLHDDQKMAEVKAALNSLLNADGAPYHGGGSGGGGGMSDLSPRVARLEDDMKELKSDMKNVRDRLAKIEGEISRLPGYPGIAVIVGVIVALGTAAQKFIPAVGP
jgi:hypothetical protein